MDSIKRDFVQLSCDVARATECLVALYPDDAEGAETVRRVREVLATALGEASDGFRPTGGARRHTSRAKLPDHNAASSPSSSRTQQQSHRYQRSTWRRHLAGEGDGLLEVVECLVLLDQTQLPPALGARVTAYAARVGWRREPRDLIHAHDVILAVQGEVLRRRTPHL